MDIGLAIPYVTLSHIQWRVLPNPLPLQTFPILALSESYLTLCHPTGWLWSRRIPFASTIRCRRGFSPFRRRSTWKPNLGDHGRRSPRRCSREMRKPFGTALRSRKDRVPSPSFREPWTLVSWWRFVEVFLRSNKRIICCCRRPFCIKCKHLQKTGLVRWELWPPFELGFLGSWISRPSTVDGCPFILWISKPCVQLWKVVFFCFTHNLSVTGGSLLMQRIWYQNVPFSISLTLLSLPRNVPSKMAPTRNDPSKMSLQKRPFKNVPSKMSLQKCPSKNVPKKCPLRMRKFHK